MGKQSDLLLSIIPFSPPTTLGDSPRETALLDLWRTHVTGADLDPEQDHEDWVEQAVRLEAALTATPNVHLTLDGDVAVFLPTGERSKVDDLADLARYGVDRTHRHLPRLPADEAADNYYRLAAFIENAGRDMMLVGHDSEATTSELVEGVLALHQRGIRRIIVKVTLTKYGLHDITLPESLTYREAHRILAEELDWTLVHLDGLPGMFILQEHVQMQYETRLFIVGGTPVTGAGCVVEHTPLNNRDQFDSQVQKWRGKTPVESAPDVVGELVDFGRRTAKALRAEDARLTSYVLDVAMGVHGPLIIECNSLRNSGLYASQPHRVVTGLLSAAPDA